MAENNWLSVSEAEMNAVLAANPQWNTREAYVGLSGLSPTDEQEGMLDPAKRWSGLHDDETKASLPAQVHRARKVLNAHFPSILFPARMLWGTVFLRSAALFKTPTDAEIINRAFYQDRQTQKFLEETARDVPACIVVQTFRRLEGREPRVAGLRWWTEEIAKHNWMPHEFEAAFIAGRGSSRRG